MEISNIQFDNEAMRTKTIETRWNECKKYLHIIHFALSLSSEPLSVCEFKYVLDSWIIRNTFNIIYLFNTVFAVINVVTLGHLLD